MNFTFEDFKKVVNPVKNIVVTEEQISEYKESAILITDLVNDIRQLLIDNKHLVDIFVVKGKLVVPKKAVKFNKECELFELVQKLTMRLSYSLKNVYNGVEFSKLASFISEKHTVSWNGYSKEKKRWIGDITFSIPNTTTVVSIPL